MVSAYGFITGGSSINCYHQANYQPISAKDQQLADFTSVILASTEEVWQKEFSRLGRTYTYPKLVLYRGYTTSAYGTGQAIMRPFYCPADQKVYIELSFYS